MRNRIWLLAGVALFLGACSEAPKEAVVEKTPDVYAVKFETSKGDFVVEVHKDWAPMGADRFHELVKSKFFDDTRFFRALKGFVVQWGISGNPEVSAKWRELRIVDDPVKEQNVRGTITYAKGPPNSRTSQVFINLVDNSSKLDGMGFAPFGKVIEGMSVVDELYTGYGDGINAGGAGPDQNMIQARGNAYLDDHYPRLDRIKTARVVPAK